MEPELYTLYNVLTTYKQSLIQILEKIDENLLVAINNYDGTRGRISHSKKFTISMEILEVIQNFIKMLYTGENTVDRLVAKLAELEQDAHPEKERKNSNPFLQSAGNENVSISSLFARVKEEPDTDTSESNEPNYSIATISETDTLVNIDAEAVVGRDESELTTSFESLGSYEELKPIVDIKVEPTVTSDSPTFENVPKTELGIMQLPNEAPTFLQYQKVDKKPSNEAPLLFQNLKVEQVSKSKEPNDDKREDAQKQSPKINRNRVSFKIESPKKTYRYHNSNDAVTKLMKMPRSDWRQEATKWLESKEKKKDFSLRTVSPKQTLNISHERKKVKEKCTIYDILEDKFCLGQSCVFCHIESPDEFYVRTDQKLFESFETYLNEDLNQSRLVVNKYKTKAEAMSVLGNFCFGFLTSKGKWYRVEILDWMEHDLYSVSIQLIDYGEKLSCDFKNLKCMIDFYAEYPRMAIKCHLAGIYSGESKIWSNDSINCLYHMSEIDCGGKFKPIFVHKDGDSYAVDFTKEAEIEHGVSLGQSLVDNDVALQITISNGADYLENIDEDFEEEFDTLNEAIAGYDAKDEARICLFTDSTGRCFKGPACKLEHGRLSKEGITTDKVLIMSEAMTKLVLPKAGQNITIVITGYVNTCHFYAQIVTKSVRGSPLNEDFIKLNEAMKANNMVQTYEKLTIYPGIGELILCPDGLQWLRGRCVGYLEDDQIEVFLVDFGYKILKKKKDLKQMKEDFLHVPFQAVECILDCCQEKKSVSLDESRHFFLQCMNMQIFRALVMDNSGREPLRLQLWDASNVQMDMALNLYSLVEPRLTDLYPAKNIILSCD